MFIVQSGPMRSSLVALSTRTVAEEEEENGDAISPHLSPFCDYKIIKKRREKRKKEQTEGLFVCREKKKKKILNAELEHLFSREETPPIKFGRIEN